MTRSAAFLVPGRLTALSGGSIYDRRIVEQLRRIGWSIDVHELDESFPYPSVSALAHAADVLRAVEDDRIVIIDGLAAGAMPDVLARHAGRLRIVVIVHLPLALEGGLDANVANRLNASEREALALAKQTIVTGQSTVAGVASMGVDKSRVAVVEPGTDAAPIARGSRGPSPNLLCVAAITAGKGHAGLVRALAASRDREWTLTCVGTTSRQPAVVDELRRLVAGEGLADRITLAGEVDGSVLDEYFARADLFVLDTQRETYGMAVAEALAHGLPVISTRTGEITRLVGDDAGLLAAPGDEPGFALALTRVLGDPHLRRQLRDGALRARERLTGWDIAGDRFATVLERVAHG